MGVELGEEEEKWDAVEKFIGARVGRGLAEATGWLAHWWLAGPGVVEGRDEGRGASRPGVKACGTKS